MPTNLQEFSRGHFMSHYELLLYKKFLRIQSIDPTINNFDIFVLSQKDKLLFDFISNKYGDPERALNEPAARGSGNR